jgi:hypothetical protein
MYEMHLKKGYYNHGGEWSCRMFVVCNILGLPHNCCGGGCKWFIKKGFIKKGCKEVTYSFEVRVGRGGVYTGVVRR